MAITRTVGWLDMSRTSLPRHDPTQALVFPTGNNTRARAGFLKSVMQDSILLAATNKAAHAA